MTTRQNGFTLIELMIVVVIVGVLAAIAVPKFSSTKSRAYVTAMRSDLHHIVMAEESFFYDSASYTSNPAALNFQQSTGVSPPTITTGPGYWFATVSHTQIPGGFTCAVAMNTTNPLIATANEGDPVCK